MVGSDDKYSLATLKKAVSAVKKDGMSYGAVSKMLGVPKPTLYGKCSETVVETSQCNSAKVKPMEEEENDDNNNDKLNKYDKVD